MKILRLILSTAALLATMTSAHAATYEWAGPCVHLRSYNSCVSYPSGECFWDASDNRCESRYDRGESGGGGYCGNLNYYSCVRTSRCFWDGSDNRCESR